MKIGRGLTIGMVVFGAVVSAVSCGKTTDGTDSNTHWMLSCEDDSECGGLDCLCGVCTKPCSGSTACSEFGESAVCGSLESCGSGQGNVCVTRSEGGPGGSGGGNTGGTRNTGGTTSSGGTTNSGGSLGTGARCGENDVCVQPSLCDPLDVRQANDPFKCGPASPSFYWNGTTCVSIGCCEGADCGRGNGGFSPEVCDRAHDECYADKGVSRTCTKNSDCSLSLRTCCHCGETSSNDVVAVSSGSVAAHKDMVCEPMTGECPPCAPLENPALSAVCVEGECKVLSLENLATCDTDGDCTLREKTCCGSCTTLTKDALVSITWQGSTLLQDALCPAGFNGTCDACASITPENIVPRCGADRRCYVAELGDGG